MITGTVVWFNDLMGFGTIAPDNGSKDLYAHFYTANLNTPGLKPIQTGQRVYYEVVQGAKGKQAANIQKAI